MSTVGSIVMLKVMPPHLHNQLQSELDYSKADCWAVLCIVDRSVRLFHVTLAYLKSPKHHSKALVKLRLNQIGHHTYSHCHINSAFILKFIQSLIRNAIHKHEPCHRIAIAMVFLFEEEYRLYQAERLNFPLPLPATEHRCHHHFVTQNETTF